MASFYAVPFVLLALFTQTLFMLNDAARIAEDPAETAKDLEKAETDTDSHEPASPPRSDINSKAAANIRSWKPWKEAAEADKSAPAVANASPPAAAASATETPAAETTPSESPAVETTPSESPAAETTPSESPAAETTPASETPAHVATPSSAAATHTAHAEKHHAKKLLTRQNISDTEVKILSSNMKMLEEVMKTVSKKVDTAEVLKQTEKEKDQFAKTKAKLSDHAQAIAADSEITADGAAAISAQAFSEAQKAVLDVSKVAVNAADAAEQQATEIVPTTTVEQPADKAESEEEDDDSKKTPASPISAPGDEAESVAASPVARSMIKTPPSPSPPSDEGSRIGLVFSIIGVMLGLAVIASVLWYMRG